MDKQPRVLIVPGASVVLQRVARKLDSRPDVSMMNTANAMLWCLRRTHPTHVLAATELDDFDAVDLVDIVPALAPSVRLILCGPATPELAQAAQGPNVELVSSVHGLEECLQHLCLTAPHQPSTSPPQRETPKRAPVTDRRETASGNEILGIQQMERIDRILRELRAGTHAQVVLLSDLAGMTIARSGDVPVETEPLYTPFLGTLFSTGTELGRMFDEVQAQRLFVHSGLQYQIYAIGVRDRWILSILRGPGLANGPRQPVLAALQRAVRELEKGQKL